MVVPTARSWFRLLWLGTTLVPGLALAVELAPGDIVLFSESPCGIYRLDPVTLVPTEISGCLGFSATLHHMAVDRRGRLLVTDEVRGIVEVSPATGARTVFVPVEMLGGPPRGIALEADGNILVSVQTAPPRVLRIDPEGRGSGVVTEGGFLVGPTGIDVMRDGSILVADQSAPTRPPIPGNSMGALLRVDPVSGTQTLVAANGYQAPQDVAWVGGDSVWIANRGLGLGDGRGWLTITRLSDGATATAPVATMGSKGVAMLPDGRVAYSGCNFIHGSCSTPYVAIYGSATLSLWGYMGTLAVVPEWEMPATTTLAPAAPNPFRDGTALTFRLARPGTAELAIFSVNGRRLTTLARGERAAGEHRLVWDGTDVRGRAQPAGVYYARLWSAEGRFTRTLVLIH